MRRGSAAGFSLIELMMAVSIIMVLMSIAIPNLLVVQQRAREATALGMLNTLRAGQETYRLSAQQYADRFRMITDFGQALGPSPPPRGGRRGRRGRRGGGGSDVLVYQGYIFRLNRPTSEEWNCTAEPIRARGSTRYFYTDETGVIRYRIGRQADRRSPVLP